MAEPNRLAAALSYQEELDAARLPVTMNPNIAAQGVGSRNRLAAALSNQSGDWSGEALPMEGRAAFLPFQDTLPGSVMNKRSLALPGIVAGAANAFTAPGRAFTGSDPTFNPGEEAANFALNVMGGGIGASRAAPAPAGSLGMNVYHGTPHRFAPTAKNPLGEFDASKIGTGEGAQAYGHGHYLAESPSAAGYYKDNITMQKSGQVLVNGKPATSEMFDEVGGRLRSNDPSLQQEITVLQNKLAKEQLKKVKDNDLIRNYETWINNLEKYKGRVSTYQPNLYKVDLPDEHIAKMLDWDKPLSQQPENVQAALKKMDVEKVQQFYRSPDMPMSQVIHHMNQQASPEKISKFLSQQGIPGIRYLDQGSRAGGAGTSNFVVFDPAHMNIIGRE